MSEEYETYTTVPFSDDAKRCSDQIRLHIVAGMQGKWAAIRLSDGGSDGIAYDTREDAIRHQLHEKQCAYIKIPWDDMPPEHAERFLAIQRELYDAGFRFCDPEGFGPIIPMNMEDLRNSINLLRKGQHS